MTQKKLTLSEALAAEVENAPFSTAKLNVSGVDFHIGASALSPVDLQRVNKALPIPFQQDPTQFYGQIDLMQRKCHNVNTDGSLSDDLAFSKADIAHLKRIDVTKLATAFAELFGAQLNMQDDEDEDPIDTAKGN